MIIFGKVKQLHILTSYLAKHRRPEPEATQPVLQKTEVCCTWPLLGSIMLSATDECQSKIHMAVIYSYNMTNAMWLVNNLYSVKCTQWTC